MGEPPAPRKRPWELHIIVCLILLLLGIAGATGDLLPPGNAEPFQLAMIGALIVTMIGLFRGNPFAYWFFTVAFGFVSIGSVVDSIEALHRHGPVAHPLLLKKHVLAVVSPAILGLLILCRARGAFPARATPLFPDLPGLETAFKIVGPVILFGAAVCSIALVALFPTPRNHSERNVSASLKTIAQAEADYRANDRDWNQLNDFWTGDVAGLYGIVPPKDSPMTGDWTNRQVTQSDGKTTCIKLIERSVAGADGNPLKGAYPPIEADPSPKAGGWFQVLRVDRSSTPPEPYQIPGSYANPSRFGFIAYPSDHIAGLKLAFIINEHNTIFRQWVKHDLRPSKNWPPGPLTAPGFVDWPSDDELKAKWEKLD